PRGRSESPSGAFRSRETDREPANRSRGSHHTSSLGAIAGKGIGADLFYGRGRSARLLGPPGGKAGRSLEWNHRSLSAAAGDSGCFAGTVNLVRRDRP